MVSFVDWLVLYVVHHNVSAECKTVRWRQPTESWLCSLYVLACLNNIMSFCFSCHHFKLK